MSKMLAVIVAGMFAVAASGSFAAAHTGGAPAKDAPKVDCKDPKNSKDAACSAKDDMKKDMKK
jgi:hypothetical protein